MVKNMKLGNRTIAENAVSFTTIAIFVTSIFVASACWEIPSLKNLDGGDDSDTPSDDDTDTGTQPSGCVRTVDSESSHSTPDGLTWESAFRTVQEGIDAAAEAVDPEAEPGDSVCQVWVVGGTYNIFDDGSENTVQLVEWVEVYGGFTGGEGTLDERDWNSNETILNGGSETSATDRVFHVVTGANNSVLDGFTVQNGLAHENEDYLNPNNAGGGMNNREVAPTVSNCRFVDNYALFGGAIENYSSGDPQTQPVFNDCIFENNESVYMGGAMDNDHSSPIITHCEFDSNAGAWGGAAVNNLQGGPLFTGCVFSNNTAPFEEDSNGGAVLTYGAVAQFSDCLFEGNQAWSGGALHNESASIIVTDCVFDSNIAYLIGGAIHNEASSPELTDCVFDSNQSTGDSTARGGAMSNASVSSPIVNGGIFVANSATDSGGAIHSDGSAPQFSGCAFISNESNWGGAISNVEGGITATEINDCVFTANVAVQGGGAVETVSANLNITDSIFTSNQAAFVGALSSRGDAEIEVTSSFFSGNDAQGGSGYGGAVALEDTSSAGFTNCTMRNNRASISGGAVSDTSTGSIQIANSILWGNAPDQFSPAPAAGVVTYSVFQGGAAGTGNLIADPGFAGGPMNAVAIGTWTTITYDPSTWLTAFQTGGEPWESDELVGMLAKGGNPTVWDTEFIIVGNDENTLYSYGNLTEIFSEGSSFAVMDFRPNETSVCIDAADGTAAPLLDLESTHRVDDPETANTGNGPPWADMGAYEYYGENMFGPDSYGYLGLTDTDNSICSDITSTGTSVALSEDLSVEINMGTGFGFPFYGQTYDDVYINENGFLSFASEVPNSFINTALPFSDIPMIAPYWDDLDSSIGTGVFYQTDGDLFHVQWAIPPNWESVSYDFRLSLDSSNGEIHFCYVNTNVGSEPNGSDATAGIQGDSDDGISFSDSAANLIGGLHVRLIPPS